jgi:hypothetical protein
MAAAERNPNERTAILGVGIGHQKSVRAGRGTPVTSNPIGGAPRRQIAVLNFSARRVTLGCTLLATHRTLREGNVRFHQLVAVACLPLACALAAAYVEKNLALVIGNDRYAAARGEQLQKGVNDPLAGGTLRQIGFDVISGADIARTLLARFAETAQRLATAPRFPSSPAMALRRPDKPRPPNFQAANPHQTVTRLS